MLELNNLNVTYPDKTVALKDITLNIKDGENVAVIGANGAGKTSLIMACVGIIPSTGLLTVNNIALTKKTIKEVRSAIGVVFQNPDDQLFMPTIYDDVAFGLRNAGLDEITVKERTDKCFALLNIEHLKNKTPLKLSGGEKRMAALATVIAMNPAIMVLDEPTAFLDPKARRSLINTLHSLPHTKLIATHDLTFAAETCERSILIKNGTIFADGASSELLYNKKLMEDCGVEAINICMKG